MRQFIHSLRGKYKFNTGGKPFAERMADLNREERELEGSKVSSHGTRRFIAAEKEIKINWLK